MSPSPKKGPAITKVPSSAILIILFRWALCNLALVIEPWLLLGPDFKNAITYFFIP